MTYWRTCIILGHILQKTCLTEGCVLQNDMFYGSTCFTGGHILLDQISYWRTCLIGGFPP